jgi:hypothetical protein
MPRIDETLDKLHGKQFFTTLDLASGYYQIELDNDAKEKTAFIVENNLYHFLECHLAYVMALRHFSD